MSQPENNVNNDVINNENNCEVDKHIDVSCESSDVITDEKNNIINTETDDVINNENDDVINTKNDDVINTENDDVIDHTTNDDTNEENRDEVFESGDPDFMADIKPTELHEKFKEFLRGNTSRSNSFNWEEELASLSEDHYNTSLSSEKLFSSSATDGSLNEDDVNGILQQNKNLQQYNTELKEKRDQLLRQLESAEDESEKLRAGQLKLQYELKNCQELMRGREKLHIEVGQLQLDLDEALDERVILESEIRRLRKEEEISMSSMHNLRDQVDGLTSSVYSLTALNHDLSYENAAIKAKCEGFVAEMESKEQEIDQKMMMYHEVKQQAEEYKTVIQNLTEEKENLLSQFHEMQLEVSVYQNYHRTEGLSPPNEKPRPRSTCLFNLQSELAAAYVDSNGEKSNESPNSLNSTNTDFNVPIINQENETQTDQLESVEVSVQTEGFDAEEMMALKTENDALKSNLMEKEDKVELLKSEIDHQRTRAAYMTSQLDVNRTRTQELIDLYNVEMNELTQLTDMLHQSAGNAVIDSGNTVMDTDNQTVSKVVTVYSSQLFNALTLENCSPRVHFDSSLKQLFSNSLLQQNSLRKWDISDHNLLSSCSVLLKCTEVVQVAINRKLDVLQNLFFRDIDQNDEHPSAEYSKQVLNSLADLLHRATWYSRTLGTVQSSVQVLSMMMNTKSHYCESDLIKPTKCLACRNRHPSISEDTEVIEVSSKLQSLLANPTTNSKLSKALMPSKFTVEILFMLVSVAKMMEKYVKTSSRFGILCTLFLLCAFFATSPLDFNVNAVC